MSDRETGDAPYRDDHVHPVARLLFGWVEAKATPGIILVLVLLIAIGLFLADVFVDRHEYLEFANATGFYGLWGFAAFAIAVLSGWPLGRLLRRDEDYYGEADTVPDDIEERMDVPADRSPDGEGAP